MTVFNFADITYTIDIYILLESLKVTTIYYY